MLLRLPLLYRPICGQLEGVGASEREEETRQLSIVSIAFFSKGELAAWVIFDNRRAGLRPPELEWEIVSAARLGGRGFEPLLGRCGRGGSREQGDCSQ